MDKIHEPKEQPGHSSVRAVRLAERTYGVAPEKCALVTKGLFTSFAPFICSH